MTLSLWQRLWRGGKGRAWSRTFMMSTVLFGTLWSVALVSLAETKTLHLHDTLKGGEIVLAPGETLLMILPYDIGTLVVEHPEVVSVEMERSRRLILYGQRPGTSHLLVEDLAGRILATVDVRVSSTLSLENKVHITLRGHKWPPLRTYNCKENACEQEWTPLPPKRSFPSHPSYP